MKISLCMIAGNEAAVILRCLDSAKNAFDELCLVKAIGAQHEDKTLILAFDWCELHGKEFKAAVYLNQIPELPHVDDFGAARNKSFSLATGDWQLWLDCDDILTPESCRSLRTATVADPEVDAYLTPYTKPGGSTCPRERLIRRGSGVWKNRIHETCVIASGRTCLDNEAVVYHAPVVGHAKDSHPRNKRLLEIGLADADRHLFYLHEELYRLATQGGQPEDRAEAVRTGKAALELLKDKPEECYEICLNMTELEPAQAQAWMFRALALQPWRREALAYLTQDALAAGKLDHAVSWFRQMDGLPRPEPLPWTHRDLWHGWGRNYLRVRILRARGQVDEAAIEHAKFLEGAAYLTGVSQLETAGVTAIGL